jgi:hypothetical protein
VACGAPVAGWLELGLIETEPAFVLEGAATAAIAGALPPLAFPNAPWTAWSTVGKDLMMELN